MEISEIITGSRLNEIQKKPDEIKLVFENSKANETYSLLFKGLLLETSGSALNKKVKNVQWDDALGFRVLTQLRYLRENPENYRQLFIQMEGSTDENKFELVGAVSNLKLSRRRKGREKRKAIAGNKESTEAA